MQIKDISTKNKYRCLSIASIKNSIVYMVVVQITIIGALMICFITFKCSVSNLISHSE